MRTVLHDTVERVAARPCDNARMQINGDHVRAVASAIDDAAKISVGCKARATLRHALLSMADGETPISEITDVPVKAALWAFDYHVKVIDDNTRPKVVIEPRFHGASGETEPPEVANVTDDIVQMWNELAEAVESPWGKARLHHLIFDRRSGNSYQHAIKAIESYLAAAKSHKIDLDRAEYLGIALRVARAVGASDLVDTIVAQLLDDAHEELINAKERPGVFFKLIKPVLAERRPPARIDELLKNAALKYKSPFILDEIIELQINRANGPVVKRALWVSRVQLWTDAADNATGILRATHLKAALECANASRERDLIEHASARLRKLRNEDLGLTSFGASTTIDESQIELFLAPIREVGNWQDALLCLYQAYGPSTGNLEQNKARVAEYSQEFVFSAQLPRQLIGGDGLPRYHPQNDEDMYAMTLAQHESFSIQSMAPFLAMAVSRIADLYGIPREEDLVAFFTQIPLTAEPLARALARAFVRYWISDFEGAAFTVVPRIETLCRNLVIAMNRGVYRLQRDQKPGQYPGLGYLLDVLKEHGMDESWHRCVLTVCANPAGGLNMRNEMAHGLVEDIGAPYAAIVLQIALYLWSLSPSASDDPDTEANE